MRLVSHESRFCLYTTPKVACTTLKLWFHALETGRLERFAKAPSDSEGEAIHDLCDQLYGDRSPAGSYFGFGFARDPFSRVASAYADKIVKRRWLGDGVNSFADFCRYLTTVDLDTCNAHWRRQARYHGGLFIPELVGRFESLQRDFDRACRIIGLPPLALPTVNRTVARGADHRRYYTRRTEALVADLYAQDFELFGYSRTL